MEEDEIDPIQQVTGVFETFFDRTLTDRFKTTTLIKFLNYLGLAEVEEAMQVACQKFYKEGDLDENDMDAAIKYFCGICRTKINPERIKNYR